MANLQIQHDVNSVFTNFFQLKDWKKRSLNLGGVFLVFLLTYILLYVLIIFASFSDIQEVSAVVFIIVVLLFLVVTFGFIVLQLFISGYQLDLIDAKRDGNLFENVAFLSDYERRVTHGFKLFLSKLVYMIIPILVYFSGYFLMFVSTALTNSMSSSGNSDPIGLLMILGSWGLIFIGLILQAFTKKT